MWHRVAWYIREIGLDLLAVFGVMLRLYQNALPRPNKIKSAHTVAFRNDTLAVIQLVLRRYGVAVTQYTRYGVEREMCGIVTTFKKATVT
jgi:hypothetical protein